MSLFSNILFLDSTGTSSTAGIGVTVGYFAIVILAFYFIAIRPQRKQEKNHAALLTTVAPGDSVLTVSGFYGVIIYVMDDVVIVEFGNNKNCRIPMKKDSIVELEKADGTSSVDVKESKKENQKDSKKEK
jgi:preprotein translocase subunit YajC